MIEQESFVSASRDTTARIWDLESGKCLHVLQGHKDTVRSVAANGTKVVTASYDTTARVWDTDTGKCLQVLEGHRSKLYTVACDEKRVITGSLDQTVKVWDAENGYASSKTMLSIQNPFDAYSASRTCIKTLEGHPSLVSILHIHENILISACAGGMIFAWDINTLEKIGSVSAHIHAVVSLDFDGRMILSGGSDGEVKLWHFDKGIQFDRLIGETGEAVWRVAIHYGQAIVSRNIHRRSILEIHPL